MCLYLYSRGPSDHGHALYSVYLFYLYSRSLLQGAGRAPPPPSFNTPCVPPGCLDVTPTCTSLYRYIMALSLRSSGHTKRQGTWHCPWKTLDTIGSCHSSGWKNKQHFNVRVFWNTVVLLKFFYCTSPKSAQPVPHSNISVCIYISSLFTRLKTVQSKRRSNTYHMMHRMVRRSVTSSILKPGT